MEHSAKRLHFSIAKWPRQSARGRKTPCWSPGCGSSPSGGAFVRLEPCEGKLSRTVLRGVRAEPLAPTRQEKARRARKQFLQLVL